MGIELPARLATLGYFHDRRPESQSVANTEITLCHTGCRDVLAKPTEPETVRRGARFRPPCFLVLRGIVMNRLLDAAVNRKISLLIIRETGFRENLCSRCRQLAYCRDRLAWPELADLADIEPGYYGSEFRSHRHHAGSCSWQICSVSAGSRSTLSR